jgi:3-deoxy-D-manno-octulosonic-acid transferase
LKIKGIYFLYRTLQAFGLPWLLLYFLWRGLGNRGYWASLAQRLGFLPRPLRQTGPGAIWLHAVSVGEILSSLEFLKRLRQEFPHTRLFVSTTTLAGRALAAEKLPGLADGIFYAPVDYVWAVRRILRTLQPSLVVICETEIWPNLFREVQRTGASLAVVNGRISDRAYPRYRRFAWIFRAVLPAADCILAQTASDRERFVTLGALPERVRVTGNLKYDFEARPAPSDSPARVLLERAQPAQVWIAASTMPPFTAGDVDEDDAVLAAFGQLAARFPRLLLVLAPRKPERFDVAARKLEAAGIRYVRRSAAVAAALPVPGVLLLDSIGELSGLFFAADVVFMGGTLAGRGGHNILEPAFFSKPVIIGPHMENFQAIAGEFRRGKACVEIAGAAELAGAVERLLEAPDVAREIGCRARACAEAQRGATERVLAITRDLYCQRIPRYRMSQPWLPLVWALAQLWMAGARRSQRRGRARRRQLEAPVISVGNISMGGTGKTPCVLRLAAQLKEHGRKPGILTRGYGRQSPESRLVLPAGSKVPTERTGDEPQLCVRSGLAPVGIGKDRFETGAALEREFGVDVLLLDDGFQHVQLARAVDIVLIDALSPFGGGGVFPLGRLREPPEGLARADLIVITRSDLTDLAGAIERQIRRWNPGAPVFRARLRPEAWIDNRTGARYPAAQPPFQRAGAFCGLGNPEAFRRTLVSMGIQLADWLEFDDHHRYLPLELRNIQAQGLAKGVEALVTTGKDAVNLCEGWEEMVAPLPLLWLETALAIDRESEFLREIERRIRN